MLLTGQLRTSSRIALQFTVFTAASTLLILLCINISFFFVRHGNDRDHLARVAIEQNRVQAIKNALQHSNKRYLIPLQLQEGPGVPRPWSLEEAEIVKYSRKLIDIIHAEDERRYLIYNDDTWKMILLDITENMQRQMDLAWLSVIILIVMIILSYRISKRFVSRGLKDLYTLADWVQDAHIENLHTKLTMNHLPEDDEINIVAGAIDDMKEKIYKQIQSIKDFVSHVSHEFKTPLMVMRSDIELAGKTKDYSDLIERNTQTVEQMQTLLDGLLVLTTAQTGKLEMTEINMTALVERVCETLAKKYKDKDVIVHKHIDQHIFVSAHQGAAESMVTNIIDNAYKYTEEWGSITVRLTDKECIVADTGIGIPAELKEKIRQPFRQADKNRQDGVGLGLAIVQKLWEVLGWKVKVEDNEEKWTKVTFTFPQ